MNRTNLEKLETIASALGDICREVVFVGGAAVELYVTNPAAPRARPTFDVDCVVKVISRTQFHEFEEMLRTKGFVNDTSEGAPICRWLCHGIQVDVMPARTEPLGFSNEWYEEGIRHTRDFPLPNGVLINILSVPYFIATKLAALKQRGIADLRLSTDFEDIVYILRNRSTVLPEFIDAEGEVREYLRTSFRMLLSLDVIGEAIASVLDFGETPGTPGMIRAMMEEIGSNPNL